MSECWRCGDDGHRAGGCPQPQPGPSPYRHGHTRKPRAREADVHAWANSIREALGWAKPADRSEEEDPA